MTEQIVDIIEANMPASSDVVNAAMGAGAAAGEYAGRQAANASLADVRALANTNKNRLDTLTAAPASGNTELVDIRVGGDNRTYATAGDAVRGQYARSVHGDVYVNSTASNPAQAPYDDADTLPVQSVVTYESTDNVRHLPDGWHHCTIITTCSGTQANYGRTQIAVQMGGLVAVRSRWVGGSPWSSWNVLPIGSTIFAAGPLVYGNTAQPPYDDADTIPVNTVVSIVSSSLVANMPESSGDGTLITLKNAASADGKVQLYITAKDRMYWRLWWNGGSPRAWQCIDPADRYDPQTQWCTLGIFPRIGVIGDSFASGYIVANGHGTEHYDLSWGQIIARRNGVNCTNYSRGGLWTRTWLTDSSGLPKMETSDPDDLYLLALGINDVGNGGASYLGTPDDMTDNPDDNPNTFYGNYARIIAKIHAHALNAKIVIMTMAREGGVNSDYNAAIKLIAEHHAIPCIVQRDDQFFTSNFYTGMIGGHPLATTYGGMALAIERLFSKCAIAHVDYFKDYIG